MATLAAGLAAPAARAQMFYSPDDTVIIRRGPYAPERYYGGYEDAMPPFEALRIIRSSGFEPLGPPVRRRWVYTIAAIHPDGEDGRVVLDARTGRIMRFVPGADDVVTAYGSPGPSAVPPAQKANVRTLRPPLPVPHVASRTPPATTANKPEARTVGAAAPPPQQQASQSSASAQAKTAENKPAENKPPVAAKPEPQAVQLQPTQPMPPVQDFE